MIARMLDSLRRREINPAVALGYLILVAVFVWTLAHFYIPAKGFSYLIAFGGRQEQSRISKLRKLDYHVERASDGYDAQYYVQIAMDPSLRNTQLRQAMDSLPYRARRILFPTTAWLLGLGRPAWILQAYALLNALSWFGLAAVLLHWFPPRHWNNFIRWAGVLFSFGVCVSFRNSLIDGPSLLLIAVGLYLADKGRPWWSTAVLALSGLGKETNLLGAASLLPKRSEGGRAWGRAVLRGLLVAAPLALWLVYLWLTLGPVDDLGARNFDLPFAAYMHKWQAVIGQLPDMIWPNFGALWGLLMLVSLTVQFAFMMLRPRWDEAWWRVGLSFALLMVVLGDAVWEGYPGAASRVLLPMQLAFNVLVPAGRGWTLILILGNLTLLSAPAALQAPSGEGFILKGPDQLVWSDAGQAVAVEYAPEWYSVESNNDGYWCWAPGAAAIAVRNPHPTPLQIRLRFSLSSLDRRVVRVKVNGVEVWQGEASDKNFVSVALSEIPLRPGNNQLEFSTDTPPGHVSSDPRPLAFSLHNLRIDVQRLQPAEPPAK